MTEYEVVWNGSTPDPLGYGKGLLLAPRCEVSSLFCPGEDLTDIDTKDFDRGVLRFASAMGPMRLENGRMWVPPDASVIEARHRKKVSGAVERKRKWLERVARDEPEKFAAYRARERDRLAARRRSELLDADARYREQRKIARQLEGVV